MKITKRQLRRIIKEEKSKLLREITPGAAGIAAMGGGTPADQGFAAAAEDDYNRRKKEHGTFEDHGVFDENYLEDLIQTEIRDYLGLTGRNFLTAREAKEIDRSLSAAANAAIYDMVEN